MDFVLSEHAISQAKLRQIQMSWIPVVVTHPDQVTSLDYDEKGSIVGIEILRASKTLEHANSVVYEVA